METIDNVNNNSSNSHPWRSDIRYDPLVNWNVIYEETSDTDMEQSDDASLSDDVTPRCRSPSSSSETETEQDGVEKRRVRRKRRASFDEKLFRNRQMSNLSDDNLNRRMAKTSPGTPIEHNSLKNFHSENLSSALFLGSSKLLHTLT